MDEKILVKNERYSLKKVIIIVLALTILASLIWFIVWYFDNVDYEKSNAESIFEDEKELYNERYASKSCQHYETYRDYDSYTFYEYHPTFESYSKCKNIQGYYEFQLSTIYSDAIEDPWLLMTLIVA